jgi:hypothetical protein
VVPSPSPPGPRAGCLPPGRISRFATRRYPG